MIEKLQKINWKAVSQNPYANLVASVLTTFIIAFLFFRFAGPVPVSVTQTTIDQTAPFNVSAEGKVTAIPDTAEINLGIEVQKTTIKETQEEANRIINQLTGELKDLGFKEEDIKTARYNLYPNYDYRQGQKIIGYRANLTLSIETQELDKISQAIDTAGRLGINQIGQLNFRLADQTLEKVQGDAREEAVKKAKNKAKEIASASGLRLGRIMNVQEQDSSPLPIMRSQAVGLMAVKEDEETTDIQPGQTEVVIKVTISYEIL